MTATNRLRATLVLVLLAVLAAVACAGPSTQPARSQLCVNLAEISSWGSPVLVNLLAQARPLGSVDAPWDGSIGAKYPRQFPPGDFGVMLSEKQNADLRGGYDYVADGKVTAIESGTITVHGLRYDPKANKSYAELFLGDVKTDTYSMVVRNTGLTSHSMRPKAYAGRPDAVWRDELITALAPYGGIRFMDPFQTRRTPLVKWADRAHVTDPSFGSSANPAGETSEGCMGIPYEWAMRLCKQTGKRFYANIPYHADRDFQVQFGKLVVAELGAAEFDAELDDEIIFNDGGGFPHGQEHAAAAEAWAKSRPDVRAWLAQKEQLGGVDDWNGWRWCLYADRVVQMSLALKDSGCNARVVFGCQAGSPASFHIGVAYIEKFYGPVKDYVASAAIAPYFGGAPGAEAEKSCDDAIATAKAFVADVTRLGLSPIFYECGYERKDNDPSLYDTVRRYFRGCLGAGVVRAYKYTLNGNPGFPWSTLESLTDLTGPKWRAEHDVAAEFPELPPAAPLVVPPPPALVPITGTYDPATRIVTFKLP